MTLLKRGEQDATLPGPCLPDKMKTRRVAQWRWGAKVAAWLVVLVGLVIVLMEWHIRLSEINLLRVPSVAATAAVPFTRRVDIAQTPLGTPALRSILPAWTASTKVSNQASENRAKQPVWRITMVLPRPEQDDEIAFRRYLAQQGMAVDYQTVMFSGDMNKVADLIARVRATRPDLIYTWGTPSTLAVAGRFDEAQPAQKAQPNRNDEAIRDIPIVFAEVTDAVGAGLMRSLASPDRNVTGVPHIAPMSVQLGLLSAYRPFSRIGFIDIPREPNSRILLAHLRAEAEAEGLHVVSVEVQGDEGGQLGEDALGVFRRAIATLQAQGAQVLYVGTSTLLALTYRDALTQAALEAQLPTFCSTESILRQSQCLYGIFSDGRNIGAYAAYKAEEILVNRQSAAHIPASPLERFSILINLPVASRLNLYPPMSLLPLAEVVPANHAEPDPQ